MNFALLCENGFDLHNDEACALAAESLELEYEAYTCWEVMEGARVIADSNHIGTSISLAVCPFRSAKLV